MTAYSVYFLSNSSAPVISIKAVTYTVRIARLECLIATSTGTAGSIVYSRNASATQSGGSTIVPTPYRDGGPAATAIAKSGATVSGTASSVHFDSGGSGYTFPFDLTIAPGDAFVATPTGSIFQFVVHFEELRLAWSV